MHSLNAFRKIHVVCLHQFPHRKRSALWRESVLMKEVVSFFKAQHYFRTVPKCIIFRFKLFSNVTFSWDLPWKSQTTCRRKTNVWGYYLKRMETLKRFLQLCEKMFLNLSHFLLLNHHLVGVFPAFTMVTCHRL